VIDFPRGRLLPLVQSECHDPELRARTLAANFTGLFSPAGARAGLLLAAGAWHDAHNAAQDLATAEGSYWHAILHRQEPDAWNSGYWFRKVGRHPIYEPLRERAIEHGYAAGARWDPERFIAYCDEARTKPGSAMERIALDVQLTECELLFDWCARPI
jgi:hypothetical protein